MKSTNTNTNEKKIITDRNNKKIYYNNQETITVYKW